MKNKKWCNTTLSGYYIGYWRDASSFVESEKQNEDADCFDDVNDYFDIDNFEEDLEFDDLESNDDSDISIIEIDCSNIDADDVVLNGVQVNRNKYVSIQ